MILDSSTILTLSPVGEPPRRYRIEPADVPTAEYWLLEQEHSRSGWRTVGREPLETAVLEGGDDLHV